MKSNQNAVMGNLVYDEEDIEIWKVAKKNSIDGWVGIFNWSKKSKPVSLKRENLGSGISESTKLKDVWNVKEVVSGLEFELNPNGVIFLKYSNLR